MPRLIHLNGPSRVGKSTIARRYADDHPGSLALDADVLAGMVGGWREDFSTAFRLARSHAQALATRHLADGRDVVVPQLVTVFDRFPGFEDAARDAGATYVEVALLVDPAEHAVRLAGKRPAGDLDRSIQESLTANGGELVDRIRGHLEAYLDERPDTLRLDTTGLDEEATYSRLLALLA